MSLLLRIITLKNAYGIHTKLETDTSAISWGCWMCIHFVTSPWPECPRISMNLG